MVSFGMGRREREWQGEKKIERERKGGGRVQYRIWKMWELVRGVRGVVERESFEMGKWREEMEKEEEEEGRRERKE